MHMCNLIDLYMWIYYEDIYSHMHAGARYVLVLYRHMNCSSTIRKAMILAESAGP